MLDALAHAHGRGIVHRDVKPSNVLLGEGDAIDVRLLDFGLAQMDEFDTLTAIGDVPGTLTYVSPERLAGEMATAAADVWAVGVMLWEALAGRHPFRSEQRGGHLAPDPGRRAAARVAPPRPARAAARDAIARALDPDPERAPGGRGARRPSCAARRGKRRRQPRQRRAAASAADARRVDAGRRALADGAARRRRSRPRPGRAGSPRCCPSTPPAGRSG